MQAPAAGSVRYQSNQASGNIFCVLKAGFRTVRFPEGPTFTDCSRGVDSIAQQARVWRDYGGPFRVVGQKNLTCFVTTRCATTAKSGVATGRFFSDAVGTVDFPPGYVPQVATGRDQSPTYLVR